MKSQQQVLLFCFVLLSTSLMSQVVINEYSASNLKIFIDDYEKTEDWLELYNASNQAVDIGGWHLSDKQDNPDKWEIPAGTMIGANDYLTFWLSGRDSVTASGMHTNFKLTQTKGEDFVVLSDPNGTIIESFPLRLTLQEHSVARSADGSTNWMICTEPSLGTSNDMSPKYTSYTSTPSMSVDGGFYTEDQVITIQNTDPDAVIRYTLNGWNPTETSDLYTGPITISQTQVLKARVFSNDPLILPGKIAFNTYFIDEDFTLSVFSVAADSVIMLANGQGEILPIGSIEYFNQDKERTATSYGELNRHGQDSWILDHRSIDWISRDEMGIIIW